MLLEEFNSRTRDAVSVARTALDIPRWYAAVVDGRPYGSLGELTDAAMRVAAPLREEEIDAALAHHPRIGERARGDSAEAAHARREQSGVDAGSADALAAANAAYENRFGRVFLVRAAGRSAEEILDLLRVRLGNSIEDELVVIDQQLREIAALRLEGSIEKEGARA